jgi:hypothetical protein
VRASVRPTRKDRNIYIVRRLGARPGRAEFASRRILLRRRSSTVNRLVNELLRPRRAGGALTSCEVSVRDLRSRSSAVTVSLQQVNSSCR